MVCGDFNALRFSSTTFNESSVDVLLFGLVVPLVISPGSRELFSILSEDNDVRGPTLPFNTACCCKWLNVMGLPDVNPCGDVMIFC